MLRKDIIDTEHRTPAQNATTFAITLCVGFTITMTICMILGTLFADEQAQQGIAYCWSILGACICSALLQLLFFTPTFIKRLSYPLRLLGFGLSLYAVLAVLAVTMQWFPAQMLGAWISFTVSYLTALAIATAFFAFKQAREQKELNDQLAAYHKANE